MGLLVKMELSLSLADARTRDDLFMRYKISNILTGPIKDELGSQWK